MTYKNSNSLSDNLEVDMLRTMITVVTVVVSLFSLTADGLWMYFLALSTVLFLVTLFIKKFPNGSLISVSLVMIISAIILHKFTLYSDSILNGYKVSMLSIHFILITYLFWKASRTLLQIDVDADISMYNSSEQRGSNSRKLTRRRNRRASFRSKNSVKIKSGQYRG